MKSKTILYDKVPPHLEKATKIFDSFLLFIIGVASRVQLLKI
jgi:hypothetical protein